MTTVDFPLFTAQQEDGSWAPFTDARFRFTIRTTRELERAAGCGIGMLQLRAQNVEAIVMMVCYGLRWTDRKMTEDKAVDIIDRFVEAGGDTTALAKALVKAMNESGVYGKPEGEEAAVEEDAPRPTPTTPPTTVN